MTFWEIAAVLAIFIVMWVLVVAVQVVATLRIAERIFPRGRIPGPMTKK